MSKEETLVKETGGHFFAYESAQGWAVYKDGGVRKYSDGTKSRGMNFPIMFVSEYLNEESHREVCETVARLLNEEPSQ